MIADFKHIIALLKAINEMEHLEKLLDNDLKDIKGTKSADSILQLIIDSTDRVFLPMLKNENLAVKIVEVEILNDISALNKIVNDIETSIKNLPKQSKIGKVQNKDEALRLAYIVCLMDDILGWYKTGKWNGPKYHINILEAKYKARVLYLKDKDTYQDAIKKILSTLPRADVEHELDVFYSKNGGKSYDFCDV